MIVVKAAKNCVKTNSIFWSKTQRLVLYTCEDYDGDTGSDDGDDDDKLQRHEHCATK